MSGENLVRDAASAVKPRLRGWLHLGTFPLAVAAGVVLVVLSPTPLARMSTAVFAVSAALLFGVSAVYHSGQWTPRVQQLLRRFDHANIFLVIAGTYTPFTLLLLDDGDARMLLTLVWAGALGGVAFRMCWASASRWIYVPVYVALGWAATFWLPDFLRGGGPAVLTLIIVGGLLYSLGGLVYALQRPDPSPRWFGFHEVFHALTVAGFAFHYVGVSITSYAIAG